MVFIFIYIPVSSVVNIPDVSFCATHCKAALAEYYISYAPRRRLGGRLGGACCTHWRWRLGGYSCSATRCEWLSCDAIDEMRQHVARRISASQPGTAAAAAASDGRPRRVATSRRIQIWIASIQLGQRGRGWWTIHGVTEGRCGRSGRSRPDSLHWQEAVRTVPQECLETQISGLHTGQKSHSQVGAFSVSIVVVAVFVVLFSFFVVSFVSFCLLFGEIFALSDSLKTNVWSMNLRCSFRIFTSINL